jgi:hypothetical protein
LTFASSASQREADDGGIAAAEAVVVVDYMVAVIAV